MVKRRFKLRRDVVADLDMRDDQEAAMEGLPAKSRMQAQEILTSSGQTDSR